jgi:hypothetical protein
MEMTSTYSETGDKPGQHGACRLMGYLRQRGKFSNTPSDSLGFQDVCPSTSRFSFRMRNVKILLASFFLSVLASAQTPAEQLTLANQLAEKLDYSGQYEAFKLQCKVFKGSNFDPNTFVRDHPSVFKPITPRSKSWPRIEAIYAAHQEKICATAVPEFINGTVAVSLAQQLTSADLNAAIAFYSSDAGKRFNIALSISSEALRREIQGKFSDPRATAELLQALEAVIAEYALNPD